MCGHQLRHTACAYYLGKAACRDLISGPFLTDFKRKTTKFLRQSKQTATPLVLSIDGQTEPIVQDAASDQRRFDFGERPETVQAVKDTVGPARK